ncbi:MAG: TfoX/Sxy family protein [Anaerolineales bacterium]|jgi:hypothetical protein
MPKEGEKPKRKWRPAPEELVGLFHQALASFPEATLQKMFGYPSAMIKGRMFAGLHQESMIVKLPADNRAELLSLEGARPFEPMPGRTMGEFVVLPPSVLASPSKLRLWLQRSFDYVASMPPKKKSKGA